MKFSSKIEDILLIKGSTRSRFNPLIKFYIPPNEEIELHHLVLNFVCFESSTAKTPMKVGVAQWSILFEKVQILRLMEWLEMDQLTEYGFSVIIRNTW